MDVYHGEKSAEFFWNDFVPKFYPKLMTSLEQEDKVKAMTEVIDSEFKVYLDTLHKLLNEKADKKFLTSDSVTIYDICLGGAMTNMFLNPKNPFIQLWQAHYDKNASDLVKKYTDDFKTEFADYLSTRFEADK
uniref:Glutathione S-transferase C-terminal domain-containing protein n=1 Tax=Strombidium rassoulzadegani TaxID=1082188 RepID=A0A7S3FSH1_9SPIT|mmetsp:Transcript_11304/g.19026  ORF Transcript_11304/g.19026 Transcript_11304/m.19026 type:complete len:133 (+) Transcript_11304:277-675(+)